MHGRELCRDQNSIMSVFNTIICFLFLFQQNLKKLCMSNCNCVHRERVGNRMKEMMLHVQHFDIVNLL